MYQPWFRKADNGLYWRPISWQGNAVTIVWGLLNIRWFFKADSTANSISDTLIAFAPYFIVSTLVFVTIIRYNTDRPWA